MRKKELLYLHSLLHMLKRHAEAEYEVSEVAFEEYESLGITPQQVYKRKSEHQEAVMILSKLLVSEFEEESDEGSSVEHRDAVPAE